MFDKFCVNRDYILGEFKGDYLRKEKAYMVVPLDIKPVMISKCFQN